VTTVLVAETATCKKLDFPEPAYFRPSEVGFVYWPDEDLAVAYSPGRASTHLINEAAKTVMCSFEGGGALTPLLLSKSLQGGSMDENRLIEERVSQTVLTLARLGLLRRST
jgi:hypothetical protein